MSGDRGGAGAGRRRTHPVADRRRAAPGHWHSGGVNPRALVQPDALLAELRRPASPPLVVDVRWALAGADRAGYLAGHLPGAVFCDLDADLAVAAG